MQTMTHRSLVHLRPKRRFRSDDSLEIVSGADDPAGGLHPVAGTPTAAAMPSFASALPSPASLTRRRVLVVDNEPASTRMVRLTLERTGSFEVREVNDSTHALSAARTFQPHLVLLDIEMPGLDGSAVARQLRADNMFRQVPLLFMTSLVTPEEAEGQIYAAGSRVLAKPVTISKLMQSVAEMLSNLLATGLPATPAPGA